MQTMIKVVDVISRKSSGPKRTDTTEFTLKLESGEIRTYTAHGGQHWVAPKRVKR